jgi:hypothetical protein
LPEIVLMIIVAFLWMTYFVVAYGTGLGTLVPKDISDVRPEPTPDTDCLCGYGIVLNYLVRALVGVLVV